MDRLADIFWCFTWVHALKATVSKYTRNEKPHTQLLGVISLQMQDGDGDTYMDLKEICRCATFKISKRMELIHNQGDEGSKFKAATGVSSPTRLDDMVVVVVMQQKL